jgi:hypothetical protein
MSKTVRRLAFAIAKTITIAQIRDPFQCSAFRRASANADRYQIMLHSSNQNAQGAFIDDKQTVTTV